MPTFKRQKADGTWEYVQVIGKDFSNVDNTRDLDKPVSTATQSAIDLVDSKVNSIGSGGEFVLGDIKLKSTSLGLDILYNGGEQTTIIEDFEDDVFNFNFTGTWTRQVVDSYEGTYSYLSPATGDGATSSTQFDITVPTGNVALFSMKYKISSELNYDFINVYIDGIKVLYDSGTDAGWKTLSVSVLEGTHTVKIDYAKDGATTGGEDTAYIDYITLKYPYTVMNIPEGSTVQKASGREPIVTEDVMEVAIDNLKSSMNNKFSDVYYIMDNKLADKQDVLDVSQTRKITISTDDPSGGSDGDIWFKY